MDRHELYYKACDYAHNLSPVFFTDIVHDAYTMWYDKTSRNLFEENIFIVMNNVKRVYWKKYFGRKSVVFTDRIKANTETPEDLYIKHEDEPVFMTYEEITQYINDYEQYHNKYPKIYPN